MDRYDSLIPGVDGLMLPARVFFQIAPLTPSSAPRRHPVRISEELEPQSPPIR